MHHKVDGELLSCPVFGKSNIRRMTFLAKWTQEWWFNRIPLPLTHNFLEMGGGGAECQAPAKHAKAQVWSSSMQQMSSNSWSNRRPECRPDEETVRDGAAGQELSYRVGYHRQLQGNQRAHLSLIKPKVIGNVIYEKCRPMYRRVAGGQAATQTEKGKFLFNPKHAYMRWQYAHVISWKSVMTLTGKSFNNKETLWKSQLSAIISILLRSLQTSSPSL